MMSAIILTAFTDWCKKKKEKNEEISCLACIFIFLLIIALVFGICCLFWWIGMLLWNGCLIAAVPVLTKVGFWQFAGIDILCGILFKGGSTSTKSKDEDEDEVK